MASCGVARLHPLRPSASPPASASAPAPALTPTLNLAPTPTPTPTPTLPTLALTRWDYLEALVENAAASSEYNILGATEGLASFLLSPAGSPLQEALADALVAEFDSLGAEALTLLI
jgi:hypothetical protein